MNSLYILWLGAVGLLLFCLAVLIFALLKDRDAAPLSDGALRSLYREQLQDLAREHDVGNLSDTDWTQAEEELHRRLLAELGRRSRRQMWHSRPWLPRASALALAVVVPSLAFALYLKVGDPQAAARLAQADELGHGVGQLRVESMVDGLALRMQAQPDDLPGWIMLARSYETMERYSDAAHAYQQAVRVAQSLGLDPQAQARLWADLADAQGSAQNGSLGGEATESIYQALELDSQQPKALALAGSAAVQIENYELARQHWQQLLNLLEPGSDVALQVQDDLLKLDLLLHSEQPKR